MERTRKRSSKVILVADDDLQLVKILKENLEAQGYVVHCGYDGGMAVSLAQKHRPDVILMDVNMPYINGLQAFQTLRSNTATDQIPVVFISDILSQVIYPIVQASTRAAHLKKPFDLVDLNSLLRQFIQQYAA